MWIACDLTVSSDQIGVSVAEHGPFWSELKEHCSAADERFAKNAGPTARRKSYQRAGVSCLTSSPFQVREYLPTPIPYRWHEAPFASASMSGMWSHFTAPELRRRG